MISDSSFVQRVTDLSHEQVRDLAGIFARAFREDPLFVYALPEGRSRLPRLQRLFAANIRYGILYGEVYRAASQGLAVWLPPGNTQITPVRALGAGMGRVPFEIGLRAVLRLEQIGALAERLHEQLADGPHWYLFLLGVDPDSQGGGTGSLLLRPVLDQADAAGRPCYLETNNPRAVHFYRKLGFEVVAEGRHSAPGLAYWAMRRETHQA